MDMARTESCSRFQTSRVRTIENLRGGAVHVLLWLKKPRDMLSSDAGRSGGVEMEDCLDGGRIAPILLDRLF